jgi:hypothetical protein
LCVALSVCASVMFVIVTAERMGPPYDSQRRLRWRDSGRSNRRLGDRLAIPGTHSIPRLPEIILAGAQSP